LGDKAVTSVFLACDGNKRSAFFVAATFLELNGFVLTLPEPVATMLMLGIASGQINEKQAAEVFRDNAVTSKND
jgi:death on curing protein